MNMIDATKVCFTKYAQFRGRARRAEFWWFMLFLTLAGIVADLITMILGFHWGVLGPISAVFSLATFLPAIAVGARRLHDIDRSGWWQLLLFVPIIGWIVLIVWWATSGSKGENRFGSDPI
ncbi:DUF805 domain-containing protein [Roseinatronobacter monicus]|uniref:Uncharacterized membrane protein YhaH (DUF805 family) n=1 Tax=Roseinatronobacter monicus TaxID=393481 RepID=A0A543KG76_9RHOB|nr:DUF805 domain-containing protein [Roseinatronobacter monicus]TQM94070.1 uncharacterized membrane protein YhaH (DUF805 family) [Roseinatronobacter monicus]